MGADRPTTPWVWFDRIVYLLSIPAGIASGPGLDHLEAPLWEAVGAACAVVGTVMAMWCLIVRDPTERTRRAWSANPFQSPFGVVRVGGYAIGIQATVAASRGLLGGDDGLLWSGTTAVLIAFGALATRALLLRVFGLDRQTAFGQGRL